MGLDMYLSAKWFNWSYGDDQKVEIKGLDLHGNSLKYIETEAGYWRKANAIHEWFVNNVQDGDDDCRSYYVSRDKLKELRSVCEAVLGDIGSAMNLLPTVSGFFFGSTDYDEFYYKDLELTIEIIDKALALPDNWEFEYSSSW